MSPSVPNTPPAGRLSADIARVLAAFENRDVTLGEIVELMRERAYSFLLLLIAFPFCTPVQVPGFSTPFGAMIAYIGLRIALGKSPSLPRRALAFKLSGKVLPRILRAAEKPVRWLERSMRPSLAFLVADGAPRRMHGLLLIVSGILLALPLPFPMTNFFPALAILFLSCGLLERDGRFSVAGGVLFLVACAYFALLALGGTALITESWEWIRGRF